MEHPTPWTPFDCSSDLVKDDWCIQDVNGNDFMFSMPGWFAKQVCRAVNAEEAHRNLFKSSDKVDLTGSDSNFRTAISASEKALGMEGRGE